MHIKDNRVFKIYCSGLISNLEIEYLSYRLLKGNKNDMSFTIIISIVPITIINIYELAKTKVNQK